MVSSRVLTDRRRNFDPTRLKTVFLTTVRPNPWNPKVKKGPEFGKVLESVRANGLRLPIVVRDLGDEYQILDGEQRWTAARELGYVKIPIYDEGEMDDKRAKELTLWYQTQVPFDEGLLVPLVLDLDKAGAFLPFTEKEMEEFRSLAETGSGSLNVVGKGKGGQTILSLSDEAMRKVLEIAREDEGGEATLTVSFIRRVPVTSEQKKIIDMAIKFVEDNYHVPPGRALELICADYLSGAEGGE